LTPPSDPFGIHPLVPLSLYQKPKRRLPGRHRDPGSMNSSLNLHAATFLEVQKLRSRDGQAHIAEPKLPCQEIMFDAAPW
jgi:hypothetical protein